MSQCIMGQGNTKRFKECLLRVKWQADLCAQVFSAAKAAVQQVGKPKSGSQEAQIARLGKEKETLQQGVDRLQSNMDTWHRTPDKAKAKIAGLRTDVVHLTEENTRLQSERADAVQARERAQSDATRRWQLVHRLCGDRPMRGNQGMGSGSLSMGVGSPYETQKVTLSSTSKGQAKELEVQRQVCTPPPLAMLTHRRRRALQRQYMRFGVQSYPFSGNLLKGGLGAPRTPPFL